MALVILPNYFSEYNAWRVKQDEVFISSIRIVLDGSMDCSEPIGRLAKKYRCPDAESLRKLEEFVLGCVKGMEEFLDSVNYEEYIDNCVKTVSYMTSSLVSRKGARGLLGLVKESEALLTFMLEKFGGRFADIPLTADVPGKEDMDNYEKMCRTVLELSERLGVELQDESSDIAENEKSVYLLGMNIMILAHAAKSVMEQ